MMVKVAVSASPADACRMGFRGPGFVVTKEEQRGGWSALRPFNLKIGQSVLIFRHDDGY
jgi:hypothetical protein